MEPGVARFLRLLVAQETAQHDKLHHGKYDGYSNDAKKADNLSDKDKGQKQESKQAAQHIRYVPFLLFFFSGPHDLHKQGMLFFSIHDYSPHTAHAMLHNVARFCQIISIL